MPTFATFGTLRAHPGKRDELLTLMLDNQVPMDGCELYVLGPHPEDEDAICIVEHWRDEASHKASLELPEVRATIQQAMPLIAGMDGASFTVRGGIAPTSG